VTFIVEGNKKRKELTLDCRAVSEVMGTVLMISIVVLALSAVAITVFSEGGEMDPVHTPHTNLQENIDTSKDKVQIFHRGGEAIDLEDIKIILSVNGTQAEFNMSDPDFKVFDPEDNLIYPEGNLTSDKVFMLGDYIEIDPKHKLNLTEGDPIQIYIVHTTSSQVIQKSVLWIESGNLPYWITPNTFPGGSVYDSSTNSWLNTYLLDEIDGDSTECLIPKTSEIYENFTFGIKADEIDVPDDTVFAEVLLKIVYRKHDNSADMVLQINNGSQWTIIDDDLPYFRTFEDCDEELPPYHITKYVRNTTELENLRVKILSEGNAANESEKTGWVDFVGIHVEY
jgi:FlaG/FlaF family flagellin (archaellin)